MSVLWCVSCLCPALAVAQQAVATMPVSDARVSGAVEIHGSQMQLASGSGVAAGSGSVLLKLTRGGEVKVCSNSAMHLAATDTTSQLTYSLDQGAMELHSTLGAGSDVLQTADLRLLISGPGVANVSVRINQQGDTCIDNAMPDVTTDPMAQATYVTVTEQLGEGLYRVQAGQRVMLEHGKVGQVVDHEKEPCGCPVASSAADDFPLAQSEGLAAAPAAKEPVVPAGEVHAQATIPFVFNGSRPPVEAAAGQPGSAAVPSASQAATQVTSQGAARPVPHNGGDLVSLVRRLWNRMFRQPKRTAP